MSEEFDYMSATELRLLIGKKEISPLELTIRSLERAEHVQKTLNPFYALMADRAVDEAKAAEIALTSGKTLGKLHGLPISVKDLISVSDAPFSLGSKTLAENIADSDAPSVERVRKSGAIIIGKTTTSEFGCKPVGDSPLTGITRNPWDLNMTPGGSSAGAAASIAAGVTSFGLGTDGGGSIRIPSAFTGLAGIKGTFARVPVWPTSATPTLAHVGPMARSMRDAALLFSVISGYDKRDPFSITDTTPNVIDACEHGIEGLRVAWSPTLGYARPDPEVISIIENAINHFESAGAHVEQVDNVLGSDPVDLWTAEFYAGVGIKLRDVMNNQRELLDPAVADILEPALSQQMQDYYTKVFQRYELRDRMTSFMNNYDVLISPVLPIVALGVGQNIPEGHNDRNLVSWVYYTYPFNLTGQPAATVCAGISSNGMPVGLQVIGGCLDEFSVVSAAAFVERSQPTGYNICNYN